MAFSALPPEILSDIFGHLQRPLPLDGPDWALPRRGQPNEDVRDFSVNIGTLRDLCLTSKAVATVASPILYSNVEKSPTMRLSDFAARLNRTALEAERSHRPSPFGRTVRLSISTLNHTFMSDLVKILETVPSIKVLVLPRLGAVNLDADDVESNALECALHKLVNLRQVRVDLSWGDAPFLARVFAVLWRLPLVHLDLEMPNTDHIVTLQKHNLGHAPSIRCLALGELGRLECQHLLGLLRLETLQCLRFRGGMDDVDLLLSHLAELSLPQLLVLGLTFSWWRGDVSYPTFEALPLLSKVKHIELHDIHAPSDTVDALLRNIPPLVETLVWNDPRTSDIYLLSSRIGDIAFSRVHLRYIRVGNGGWSNFDASEWVFEIERDAWQRLQEAVRELEITCEREGIHIEPKGLSSALTGAIDDSSCYIPTRYGVGRKY